MKDISVIVCSYNRREKLRRLVESIVRGNLESTFDWEVVIVDNASNDGTHEDLRPLLEQHPGRLNYLHEGRRGKARALNTGVAAAGGRVLALTDSDAQVAPDWLRNILAHMDTDPQLGALGGRVALLDPNDYAITIRDSTVPADVTLENFQIGNIPILGCNFAVRSELARNIGPFDVKLGPGSVAHSGDDADFVYRLCCSRARVRYLPDVLVYHDHGRNEEAEIAEKRQAYMTGRGAFYWKYGTRLDRVVLKLLYWDLRYQIGAAARNFRHRETRRRVSDQFTYLGRLLKGAFLYARG